MDRTSSGIPRARHCGGKAPVYALAGGLLVLGGCATYRPLPLPDSPDLKDNISTLSTGAPAEDLPGVVRHAFDGGAKLNMVQVATLAVVGNPGLKAARAKVHVARAEAFSAGLLPDPQLSFSLDHPTDSIAGLTNAYGIGLNYDLGSLFTHAAKSDAFSAASQRARLELLWQEWQVIEKARSLYVTLAALERKSVLLRQVQALFTARYQHSSTALELGDMTVDAAGTDLTALMDVNTSVALVAQQINQTRHDLNALLGLGPDVVVAIVDPAPPPQLSSPRFQQALKTVATRRPDLLALKAGYLSQEAKVRQAILAQFPSINIGFNHARDTSDIHTIGFGITVNLPIFNRNQGDVRVQRATRSQLQQEYQARLDQSQGQADQLWQRDRLLIQQSKNLETYLPALRTMVAEAQRAYGRRDISALSYINLENTLVQKRIEEIDLKKEIWMSRIALDTLLAWPGTKMAGRALSKDGAS